MLSTMPFWLLEFPITIVKSLPYVKCSPTRSKLCEQRHAVQPSHSWWTLHPLLELAIWSTAEHVLLLPHWSVPEPYLQHVCSGPHLHAASLVLSPPLIRNKPTDLNHRVQKHAQKPRINLNKFYPLQSPPYNTTLLLSPANHNCSSKAKRSNCTSYFSHPPLTQQQ